MTVDGDFDFSRRRIEANEELKAVAWAENNGWLSRKLKFEGRRSAPDRLFAGYGVVVLAEFKRPSRKAEARGGKSAGQSKEAQRFAAVGVNIPTFYTADECVDYLRTYMLKSLLT